MKLISPGEKGYPNEVCSDCGREAALRANTKCLSVSTYHQGKCEVCGRLFQKVTEPRDFGYPPLQYGGRQYDRRRLLYPMHGDN